MSAQTRRKPDSDFSPSHGPPSEKKPRLEPISSDPSTSLANETEHQHEVDAEPFPEVQESHPSLPSGRGKGKGSGLGKKQKKRKRPAIEPYSSDDVLWRDIISLLGKDVVDKVVEEGREWDAPFEGPEKRELEVVVSAISSGGESLSILPPLFSSPQVPWVIVTPYALPGERILVRVYRHSRLHSVADLIKVVESLDDGVEINGVIVKREQEWVKCRYFGKCAGCQYQMLSYETQLELKRNVVVKAYQNFSCLPSTSLPPILPTIPSPLQYAYRTKISPHFEAVPSRYKGKTVDEVVAAERRSRSGRPKVEDAEGGKEVKQFGPFDEKPDWLNIGFNRTGTRLVMDIEECPLATPVINESLSITRENVVNNITSYKKGVSLLFRDSLEVPSSSPVAGPSTPAPAVASPSLDGTTDKDVEMDALSANLEKHVCITNHKAIVRERVGDFLFEFPASSFFQNNNSVLVPLTTYVRDAIFPPSTPSTPPPKPEDQPTHLVDAYCGSGLFAITLSPHFSKIAGIEISQESIKYATTNANLNSIPPSKITFRAGDAVDIFSVVGDFPPAKTVLLIDPPRKGCDEKFVEQLIRFGAGVVVYVSCNVHTQARDVGMILGKGVKRFGEEGERRYVVESLRGFDLFPQTAHVESVAVLRLV
ncbi:hypothetical protein JAAARDRAFT_41178 [Jaapia argillacea MUCL 33604]|uniref:TRAM domain-containing protein n=1 Tax=Jaapia argillacea MUCL 33604 TaxID=933084 RepID=A0A067P967_9AGAM|nr:hypothetical protein JAAARDRAFT_41178 [Jaapia argillacea MUCL 33604]